MKPTLILCLSIGVAACTPDPSSQLNCGSVLQLDVDSSIEIRREHARAIAESARELRQRIDKSPSVAGFTGAIMRRIAGTDAYDIGVEIATLRVLVARQVARKQALLNDGQVLVPMQESWACEMLADSVLSLDPGQGPRQLKEHLQYVERRFEEASHKKDF